MIKTPGLVSIVIPAYNRAALLKETLDSVCAQTYLHWEAVVVDDHSTDDTWEMVRREFAKEPRLRLHSRTGETRGAPVCRNQGTELAQGDYLIYLDSDDLLGPDALARRVDFLRERPGLDFCVTPARPFETTPGDREGVIGCAGLDAHQALDTFLAHEIAWQTTAPLWRREALQKFAGWDEELKVNQDTDFFCRALLAGLRYDWLDEPDYYYRVANVAGDKIGYDAFALPKLPSIGRRLGRFHEALIVADPHFRRHLPRLAANFFMLAQLWSKRGDAPAAAKTWREARERNLVSARRYREGAIYLFLMRRHLLFLFSWYMNRFWPRELTLEKTDWALSHVIIGSDEYRSAVAKAIEFKQQRHPLAALRVLLTGIGRRADLLTEPSYRRLLIAVLLSGLKLR